MRIGGINLRRLYLIAFLLVLLSRVGVYASGESPIKRQDCWGAAGGACYTSTVDVDYTQGGHCTQLSKC